MKINEGDLVGLEIAFQFVDTMKVMSGLNSRGINSQFYFNAQGLKTASITTGMSSVVIADTTAQLRITAGRSCSVVW